MILAIDPGPRVSSWVTFDETANRVAEAMVDVDNQEVLRVLREVESSDGSRIVIEDMDPRNQPLGHDVKNTLVWIGRFHEASGGELVARSRVWGHLGARNDGAVKAALIDKLGPKTIERWEVGPKGGKKKILDPGPTYGVKSHAWQALGLAVTYAETVLARGAGG